MRRTQFAFIILGCILALILYSNWLVSDTSRELLGSLEQVELLCTQQKFEQAKQTLSNAQSFFEQREHQLAIFIKRDFLGNTAVSLSGLEAYLSQENLADFELELLRAKAQLEVISHLFFSML
mgnify:CR=1 FL=1